MSYKTKSSVSSVLKLRILVGFLGERSQFGWWPTSFYDASGRLFLEPIFPKSQGLAQYNGVTEAARRLHDEHLSVGTYHLFRLPEEIEQDLHDLMQEDGEALSPATLYGDAENALSVLESMSAAMPKAGVGPVSTGNIADLYDHLGDLAAVYSASFKSNTQSFPYLVR
jgi:hypothetical protein